MIKWVRLKETLESVLKEDFNIETELTFYLVSNMPAHVKGNIVGDIERGYTILINMQYGKTCMDIIKIIVHEVAHIITGYQHGENHAEIVVKLKDKVKEVDICA